MLKLCPGILGGTTGVLWSFVQVSGVHPLESSAITRAEYQSDRRDRHVLTPLCLRVMQRKHRESRLRDFPRGTRVIAPSFTAG